MIRFCSPLPARMGSSEDNTYYGRLHDRDLSPLSSNTRVDALVYYKKLIRSAVQVLQSP